MSNDNKDWDELINEEVNPYDNPDMTFYYEEDAYRAGYNLGLEDIENNNTTDLERDIDYGSFADEEIIDEFKQGYKKGSSDGFDKIYGNDEDSK